MSDFMRDEALNALVRELNRARDEGEPPAGASEPSPLRAAGRAEVGEDEPLDRILAVAVRREANDLLLVPGSPPVLRVAGRLVAVDAPPLEEESIRQLFAPHVGGNAARTLQAHGAIDFSLRLASSRPEGGGRAHRFRVNLHRQRGGLAAAIRLLPSEVPTLAALGLPATLAELVRPTRGLVLVCGPTGAGKSTTLAALVGEINRARTCHVVTIEEPVEYEHPNLRSLVEQVEVGADAPSFAAALRAALRQDPDVLLVGEMRDLETISIALTAAETGHLVLSTLHTSDAAQAVHRVVDVFPAAQQEQVRQQLALALNAVVCQQLIPRADGAGNVPAVEVLIATLAVRQHIRKDRVQNLRNEITLGKKAGMIALEESLARLVRAGAITLEEAQVRASQPDALETLLKA
ncbi:MAG TPA: PilT/PilU family type 4a pilus ATPase [Thermoanaerobaculaceae bacterium]|nr:PilT/PilU family type 4a pilus ATPase [Thermoanaerobaculaceae bacterium]